MAGPVGGEKGSGSKELSDFGWPLFDALAETRGLGEVVRGREMVSGAPPEMRLASRHKPLKSIIMRERWAFG